VHTTGLLPTQTPDELHAWVWLQALPSLQGWPVSGVTEQEEVLLQVRELHWSLVQVIV
jgi:hypothetical protein